MSCFQFFYLLVSGSQVPILAHPEKTTANLGLGTIQESSSLCQNLARPDSIDTTCTENSNENWLMKVWWLLMIYWWCMMIAHMQPLWKYENENDKRTKSSPKGTQPPLQPSAWKKPPNSGTLARPLCPVLVSKRPQATSKVANHRQATLKRSEPGAVELRFNSIDVGWIAFAWDHYISLLKPQVPEVHFQGRTLLLPSFTGLEW